MYKYGDLLMLKIIDEDETFAKFIGKNGAFIYALKISRSNNCRNIPIDRYIIERFGLSDKFINKRIFVETDERYRKPTAIEMFEFKFLNSIEGLQ